MKNVLYTSDSNYFNYMYVSIYSLLKNNQYPIVVHVIQSDFTNEQISKLERLFSLYKNATVKFYSLELLRKTIEKISLPKWRGTDISNARLFAHEIIDVYKILYIDSDTIIASSLEKVFDTNIEKPVSGVRELVIPNHIKPYLNSYYNSGILLFDYQLWDQMDCDKLIFDAKNDLRLPLIYPGQDLLHLALHENLGLLSPNYNVFPLVYNMIKHYPHLTKKYFNEHCNFYSYDGLISCYNNPYIYHLLNYCLTRPWINNKVHPFNSIFEQYFKTSDIEFESDEQMSFFGSMKFFSFLSVLLQVSFPDDYNIKEKIRKILYFKSK